ncbi:MAG: hypothetical protein HDT07_02990 [Bacteroidales bacterium]|nr:hypothetical protein [Bacteroidales bacterium]
MKKSLLIASMALMGASSALAVTDGFTYETTDGIKCENLWIADRTSNMYGWNDFPFAQMYAKARTAAIAEDNGKNKVIVGWSKTMEVDGESNDFAHIVVIDFETGKTEKTVQMTCDGAPVKGLLCANQVGCDDFGHVWFAGYVASTYNAETQKFTPLTIYYVKDLNTGECVKAAELMIPEDETDAVGRIDYCDLNGDVTRESAPCTVMTPLADPAQKPYVLGWRCEQGENEWVGAMDDYVSAPLESTCPADLTSWGTAPMVRIVKSEDYAANLFYVDGFTTYPTLYDNSGAMLESFFSADELKPAAGTNGVGEFTIGDRNFIAYSIAQYNATPGCQVRVCELGENQSFEGMKSFWLLPENGLGEVSDGGTRMHAVETRAYPDANGKQGVNLLTYKCNNGMGVYGIGEDGWNNPAMGGVEDIVADEDLNAPVQYFNLNGVSVDGNNLPAGLYITRQGSKVNKVVVK